MITYFPFSAKEETSETKGRVTYLLGGKKLSPEELAIHVYKKKGHNAKWTENEYWCAVMGLLFWESIFAKVKGAILIRKDGFEVELEPNHDDFENLFKATVLNMNGMPHDFFSDEFYTRRKSIINNRIMELRNSDIIEKIKYSYSRNYGKNCRAIGDWNKYTIEELTIPLSRIDKNAVIEICHRLLKNFRENRRGLPDLIVYTDTDFFFSEVKSKNDKISQPQRNWHSFLSESLNLKVEMFLINQSDKKIKNLKKKTLESTFEFKISFGKSSSQKRQKAIDFISAQSSFELKGEGKDAIYSASFSTSDIGSLYKMLDLTSGWKTQKIEIGNEIIKSGELRGSLNCYRQKKKEKASNDWCKQSEYYEVKHNPFNCKQLYFRELERGRWSEYGYIDTDKGEWIFDKEKIKEKVEEDIHRLRFCPLFDPKKILNAIKKLPDRINPKTDTTWAFQSQDYHTWIWYNNKWLSHYGDTNFPSFSMMIGVQKITTSERKEIIRDLSSGFSRSGSTITFNFPEDSSGSASQEQKSGCFIATSIYRSYDAWQVVELRKYRDQTLLKSRYGRLFVKYYYRFGPHFSKIIDKFHVLQKALKPLFNLLVNKLSKK